MIDNRIFTLFGLVSTNKKWYNPETLYSISDLLYRKSPEKLNVTDRLGGDENSKSLNIHIKIRFTNSPDIEPVVPDSNISHSRHSHPLSHSE